MAEIKLPTKTVLSSRIREFGISKSVLKRILPEWWDDSVLSTNAGFVEFSQILKNRLGLQTVVSESGEVSFSQPAMNVQYKKRANTDVSSLSEATLLCQAACRTVQRILVQGQKTQDISGLSQALLSESDLSFERALQLCWSFSVPVLYISKFPAGTTKPAGLAVRERDRFSIVLCHKNQSPSMQLFVLLHEVGHIMRNHLAMDGVITDVTMSELGDSLRVEQDQQEIEADDYALKLLRKGVNISTEIESLGAVRICSDLVLRAHESHAKYGVNLGHYILSYGRSSKDWPMATNALKFVEKSNALKLLKDEYLRQIESFSFSRDDRDFLSHIQELS